MLLLVLSFCRAWGVDGGRTSGARDSVPDIHRSQRPLDEGVTALDPYAGHVMPPGNLDLINIKQSKLVGMPSLLNLSLTDPTCYESQELRGLEENKMFLTSKHDLYDKLGVDAGLHGNGKVSGVNLDLTIDAHFSQSAWSSNSFNAAWFVNKASVKAVTVRNNCYTLSRLNSNIKRSFLLLPLEFNPDRAMPSVPDYRTNFSGVRDFLLPYLSFVKYSGMFVMHTVKYGTRVDIFWTISSDFQGSHSEFRAAVEFEASKNGMGGGAHAAGDKNHTDVSEHYALTKEVLVSGGSRAERINLHSASASENATRFALYADKFLKSNGTVVVGIEWTSILVYLRRFANSLNDVERKSWSHRIDNLESFYYEWNQVPPCADLLGVRGRCLCGPKTDYLHTGRAAICEENEICSADGCLPSCSSYLVRNNCENSPAPCSWDDISTPNKCVYVRYDTNGTVCNDSCMKRPWTKTRVQYHCQGAYCSLPGYTTDQPVNGRPSRCNSCVRAETKHVWFVCAGTGPSQGCSPRVLSHGESANSLTRRRLMAQSVATHHCVHGGKLHKHATTRLCLATEYCDISGQESSLCVSASSVVQHNQKAVGVQQCLGAAGSIPYNVQCPEGSVCNSKGFIRNSGNTKYHVCINGTVLANGDTGRDGGICIGKSGAVDCIDSAKVCTRDRHGDAVCRLAPGVECHSHVQCASETCAWKTWDFHAQYICCSSMAESTNPWFGGRYCHGTATVGQQCKDSVQCESDLTCLHGVCAYLTPLRFGMKCHSHAQCASETCAWETWDNDAQYICCSSMAESTNPWLGGRYCHGTAKVGQGCKDSVQCEGDFTCPHWVCVR